MGSNSQQGWYLFLFIVGFTLGPAGLFALGWPAALIGFALLAASFAGFRAIKQPAAPDNLQKQSNRLAVTSVHATSKSY